MLVALLVAFALVGFVVVVGVLIAIAAGRPTAASVGLGEPAWTHYDADPEVKPGYKRTPDTVQHWLHLAPGGAAGEYRVLTTWINDDIAAESDTSVVRETFDVRRSADGVWEIRPSERNGSRISDSPWQPAPPRFVPAWTAAWRQVESASRSALIRD